MVEESSKDDLSLFYKAKKMLEDIKYSIDGEKVSKLKKALSGRNQSGRQWYKKLDSELQKL